MSSRADPARIEAARRCATRNRLIGERMTEASADEWIAAWEEEAADKGLQNGAAYWDAGWEWIAGRRARREKT